MSKMPLIIVVFVQEEIDRKKRQRWGKEAKRDIERVCVSLCERDDVTNGEIEYMQLDSE